jgi:hypothetical protein
MMKQKKCFASRLSTTILVTIILCLFGTVIAAAPVQDDKPIADEMIGASGITWTPKMTYVQMVVNVSRPDGTVVSKTFARGDAPYLDLNSIMGDRLNDGLYTYELQMVPNTGPKVRQAQETAGLDKEKNKGWEALTQTGHFRVQGGAIVTGSPPEGRSGTKDVLHYDDVIITGSLCVGFDCADGESFGFDTIILKEHNLRIYFNDTSYTASYPTNSWRITINDSTNGGASYFSVDDVDDGTSIFKVEAGAPSNSLYVEDYGRVGLGTSTPVVELHIKDSDTPTLRLEQDSSGGWTAQTFDVAGNESNFFVRDATNGSKLPFRIQPSTPSSTLCLKSDGYVGIGTWSPSAQLHVEDNGPTKLVLYNTGADKWAINSSNNGLRFNANDSATVLFRLTSSGDLYVEGDISSNSGTCCVPDYVFDSNYPLMSIADLAEFIKKEKHLPNIPSAVEMKENGVKITELQMKLLEKVEELTLYIVSQQETINNLKKEIAELKKK